MRTHASRFFHAVLAGACGLWLAVTPAPAPATTLNALGLPELVGRADRIFVGTVESQQARFADAGTGTIVTEVKIRISRDLLGAEAGSVVTLRHLGGVVGDIGQRVFGEASYKNGEEVLVFSEARAGSDYAVGMAQGALHVAVEGGKKMVHSQLAGAEVAGGAAAPRLLVAPGQARSLDELVQVIQAEVAVQKKPQKAGR